MERSRQEFNAESAGQPHSGFAVIVLAAGTPARNGRSSRLARYRGRSLVEHATRSALASGACEVLVVAGDDISEVRRCLRTFRVRVVHNPLASEGISSSIRAGLSSLSPRSAAAIITLCDRPNITPGHLRALGQRVLTAGGPPVVASAYDGVLGAPCAFARQVFPSLLELSGQHGARHLIRAAGAAVEVIFFAHANREVEARGDYLPFLSLYRAGNALDDYADSRDARGPPARFGTAPAV